jgi:hypothetical protein
MDIGGSIYKCVCCCIPITRPAPIELPKKTRSPGHTISYSNPSQKSNFLTENSLVKKSKDKLYSNKESSSNSHHKHPNSHFQKDPCENGLSFTYSESIRDIETPVGFKGIVIDGITHPRITIDREKFRSGPINHQVHPGHLTPEQLALTVQNRELARAGCLEMGQVDLGEKKIGSSGEVCCQSKDDLTTIKEEADTYRLMDRDTQVGYKGG